MRNAAHPEMLPEKGEGGWEFLIPNSQFLIRREAALLRSLSTRLFPELGDGFVIG
jgi:hypothetical protein